MGSGRFVGGRFDQMVLNRDSQVLWFSNNHCTRASMWEVEKPQCEKMGILFGTG
jgi:ribosomal protein L24E